MRRIIILLAVVVLSATVSCSTLTSEPQNSPEQLPPRNPNIAPEPITLEVWLDLNFTRDDSLFEEMAEDFESVYPEVEVEIFSFVRESIPQKVSLAVQSGIPP